MTVKKTVHKVNKIENKFQFSQNCCLNSTNTLNYLIDCDFKPINSDFEPIGDIAGGVADNSETQHDEKIVLTEYEIETLQPQYVHQLGRSNSGTIIFLPFDQVFWKIEL